MSIEQRVTDALDDFEAMVAEGGEVKDALSKAAEDNGLRPEVLVVRARKKFGELESLPSRLSKSAEISQRAARIKSAVFKYCQDNFGVSERVTFVEVEAWLEEELSIRLSEDERKYARNEVQLAFHRSIMRDLDGLFRDAGIAVDTHG